MPSQLHRLLLAAVLAVSLLPFPAAATAVTEPAAATVPVTEPAAPTETVPAETTPAEPENPAPVVLPADTGTAVYQICERLLENSEARHAIVYHSGTGQVLYSRTVGNGKLFPASITKLFSAYVALQYLDPDTVITAGSELKLVHEGSSLAWIAKGAQPTERVARLIEQVKNPAPAAEPKQKMSKKAAAKAAAAAEAAE